jgi:MSHA pilin protein MshA
MTTRRTMQSNLRNAQRGFTLIELIMVIVILGILAAVAVPKFVNVSSDAKLAAAMDIFGQIQEACQINPGLKALGKATAVTKIVGNPESGGLIQTLPSGWTKSADELTIQNAATSPEYSVTITAAGDGCTVAKGGSVTSW